MKQLNLLRVCNWKPVLYIYDEDVHRSDINTRWEVLAFMRALPLARQAIQANNVYLA